MAITYITLTQDEIDLKIAQSIRAREEEHFHYELNRKNYEELLNSAEMKALPEKWPDELSKYQGISRDKAIEQIDDNATLATVQALQLRDQIKRLHKAESLEAARVEKYHSQLADKLPKAKAARDAALAKEKSLRGG
jgi:hypothetical protein